MSLRRRLSLSPFALIMTLAPGGALRAQDAPAAAASPSGAAADAATHEELRALRRRVVEAFNARDVDGLVAQAHPAIVFTTMNNDVARGREGVRSYFQKMMAGPTRVVDDIKIDFEPDALTALYGDTGISTGYSDGHYKLTSGMTLDVHARWTATLVKHEGAWRVAAFHYSTNVFDNAILTRLKRMALTLGAVAALASLGVGWFLGRRRRAS